MTAYDTGTSTRKVDDHVKALGCDFGVSNSTVSRIRAGIDREVAPVRQRPLGHTTSPYVFVDATYVKTRIDEQAVSRAVVIAAAVTTEEDREVLFVDAGDSGDGVFWAAFLTSLTDRGSAGVNLVIRMRTRDCRPRSARRCKGRPGSAPMSIGCATSCPICRAGRPRCSPRSSARSSPNRRCDWSPAVPRGRHPTRTLTAQGRRGACGR